ncbi:MAG: response regulator transcription factor [Acidimicrobiia bacterium]|nr:response regulator transcription factor [Acidimicrobiia bacterium]
MPEAQAATRARILVVDDEEPIRDVVSTALDFAGFDVRTAPTGNDALSAAQSFRPDLVVLDVMLPDLDGFAVCAHLRRRGDDVPVIFLTARDADDDKISGFDEGGDDYLTKPFSLHELVARIKAVLRRAGNDPDARPVLSCDDLRLDLDAHRVTRSGTEIQLSVTEFRLLEYLLRNVGRAVPKHAILVDVWGIDFDGDVGVVETYVSYLRKKVDTGRKPLIHTVRSVGYSLREP